jgi:hypothetical protein
MESMGDEVEENMVQILFREVDENMLQMLFREVEEREDLVAGREASLTGSRLDSSEMAERRGPEGDCTIQLQTARRTQTTDRLGYCRSPVLSISPRTRQPRWSTPDRLGVA